MSANGGVPAPTTQPREYLMRCCAKCRRGTPAFGFRPCGYDLFCPNGCHAGDDVEMAKSGTHDTRAETKGPPQGTSVRGGGGTGGLSLPGITDNSDMREVL